jgi:hypothetical protein
MFEGHMWTNTHNCTFTFLQGSFGSDVFGKLLQFWTWKIWFQHIQGIFVKKWPQFTKIWLNLLLDNHQFSCITKLEKKEKLPLSDYNINLSWKILNMLDWEIQILSQERVLIVLTSNPKHWGRMVLVWLLAHPYLSIFDLGNKIIRPENTT